jgi:integrase
MIPENPTAKLIRFKGGEKKRGIFTEEEVSKVFSVGWTDRRAYIANILSATTGLRSGECLAIRRVDISDGVLNVEHSYSPDDGLKTPKNGESRKVPLMPEVQALLLELLEKSEEMYGDDAFAFYGTSKDKPCESDILLNGLHNAIETLNADLVKEGHESEQINWKERNIVFHSWRHYWAARMSDRMTAEQLSRITGHKSKAVFEEYADHITDKNIEEVGKVGREVFSNIINLPVRQNM